MVYTNYNSFAYKQVEVALKSVYDKTQTHDDNSSSNPDNERSNSRGMLFSNDDALSIFRVEL